MSKLFIPLFQTHKYSCLLKLVDVKKISKKRITESKTATRMLCNKGTGTYAKKQDGVHTIQYLKPY
jgi:hypothetical protein